MSFDQKRAMEINAEAMAIWLESKKNEIPHADKLITKLRRNKHHEGHTVHANLVKNIYEDGTFQITDIENDDGDFDIDIELDNSINIQVQYGTGTSYYYAERGFVSELGGVKTDWEKDEEKILEKVGQLPDTGIGIMFRYVRGPGSYILPEWRDELPDNKVIVFAYQENYGNDSVNVAEIHCSKNCTSIETIKKVVIAAGFNIKGIIHN